MSPINRFTIAMNSCNTNPIYPDFGPQYNPDCSNDRPKNYRKHEELVQPDKNNEYDCIYNYEKYDCPEEYGKNDNHQDYKKIKKHKKHKRRKEYKDYLDYQDYKEYRDYEQSDNHQKQYKHEYCENYEDNEDYGEYQSCENYREPATRKIIYEDSSVKPSEQTSNSSDSCKCHLCIPRRGELVINGGFENRPDPFYGWKFNSGVEAS
jgi:hypothetical protein